MDWNTLASRIVVILVEPEHPGNIGACARAMNTMGLTQLLLVNPVPFTQETFWLAHASEEIVHQAQRVDSFEEATQLVERVFATSNAPPQRLPCLSVRPAAKVVVAAARNQRVGLVFGRERTGLLHSEFSSCERIITIPTATTYPSLNLSQAVMVLLHELFHVALESTPPPPQPPTSSQKERLQLADHFYRTLDRIGYHPRDHELVWTTMRRSFLEIVQRGALTARQVRFLHKYFHEVERSHTQ